MASDKPDKTVFRQAKGGGQGGRVDATIIRPSPGRRSGNTQMPGRSHVAENPQEPMPRHTDQTANPPYHDHLAGHFSTHHGLNPLVNAASTLLAVFYKTRQSLSHPNVGALHQQLVSAIRNFESSAKSLNLKPEIVISARYILCAALDEAVLNTPWGAESAWTQRTLLSMFHNETNGGEKFFLILDRMKTYPADNLDILELMYILLSLGFEGKYRVIARGRDAIEQIRDELYRVIRTYRGDYERALSPSWQGLGKTRNTLARYVPMWVLASIAAGVMVLGYTGFRYWLHHSTADVTAQLSHIATPETAAATVKQASQ